MSQHRLPTTNPTFRGNLLVAEGTQSHVAILNQSDGIHPTAEGQRLVADNVWPHLRPLLSGP